MSEYKKTIIDEWQRVAAELSIQIENNVVIEISSELKLDCPVLVKNFGHTNGMLLFESYDPIRGITNKLNEKEYGYSVLPFDSKVEFDIESFKDMLCDWGWVGPKDRTPRWL